MKHAIIAAAVCATSVSFADIYYFAGAETASWQDVNSYRVGSRDGAVPGELPGADDDVWIGGVVASQPKSVTLGAADLAFVSALHSINVRYGVLTIDVPTDAHLACAINGANESGIYGRYGKVIKRGAGALYLDCFGKFLASKQPSDYLFSEMVLEEGEVYLQKDHAENIAGGYFGILDIHEGTAFYLPNAKSSSYNFDGLNGKGQFGLVPGYVPTSSDKLFEVGIGGAQNYQGVFEGYLTGALRFCLTENSHHGAVQYFTNPTNNFTGAVNIDSGSGNVLGFLAGGARSDVQSLGTNMGINIQNRLNATDSRLLYLGEEDGLMAKVVNFGPGTATIDAGGHGGLTLGGLGYLWFNNFSYTDASSGITYSGRPGVGRLVLAGDGPVKNVWQNGCYNRDVQDEDPDPKKFKNYRGQPLAIVKSGKGTWLIKHNTTRQNNGVVAADEGTLQFETVVPIGPTNICSLGRGTKTYDPDYDCLTDDVDETKKVGYQLRVGGGTTAGTLEYVGTAAVKNFDRVLAVNGNGTFKNSSAKHFLQDGITTTDKVPAHTLTLAGSGDGMACNITNVTGTLNLVKEGAGCWTLGQQLDIKGTLEVKEGTFVVNNPTNYTWFRFTCKENMNELMGKPDFSSNIRMREFALYDAEGRRQNLALERRAGNDIENLQEGQAGFQQGSENANGDSAKYWINMLFDNAAESTGTAFYGYGPLGNDSKNVPTGKGLIPDREDSWLRLVMRLQDDVNEIAAFDYVCIASGPKTKGSDDFTGADTWYVAEPRIYTLEGSTDGIHWSEPLYSELDSWQNRIAKASYWASTDGTEAFVADAVRTNKGFRVNTKLATAPALQNVTSVSVAAGATLKLVGDIAPIKGLKIDAQAGMGTILGKPSLAATGVLDLVNAPDADSYALAIDWSQFANPAAIDSWTLLIGGAPTRRQVFKRTANGLQVEPRGMVILMR